MATFTGLSDRRGFDRRTGSAVSDPTELFECKAYAARGAIFWCDMYAEGSKFVRMYDPWRLRARPTVLEAWLQDLLDVYLIRPV